MKQIPWQLLKKLIKGQLSDEERLRVDEWIDEDSENTFIVDELAEKMRNGIPYPGDFDPDEESAWQKMKARLQSSGAFVYTRKQLYRFAAIITIPLMLAGFAGGVFLKHDIKSILTAETFTVIYSPGGQKTLITLPDKSKVWLNAKTTLKYSSDFNQKNRELYLDGEAYFDVAKKKIPFIVHTSAINLKVLGTAFNVKCYSDEKTVEATLVRGSLKIEKFSTVNGLSEEVMLKPNQKIVFQKEISGLKNAVTNQGISDIQTSDVAIAKKTFLPVKIVAFSNNYNTKISTSWKEGLLILKGEKLEDLATKIERRYDVQIIFDNDEIKNFEYSGTLRELSLEQLMNALKMTSPITFTIKEKTVFIKENKEVKGKYQTITN
jgi:ferric-dicitrate binding protein FerR (iron transport regulator)